MHLNPAAPVLALPGEGVQVGWDSPLVIEDVTASQARFLRSLEGGRRVGAAERRRHGDLLAQLDERGLLIADDSHAAHHPADRDRCVRIHGAGALGTEAAVALARAEVPLTVVDGARARAGSAPHLPDADCGAVALARVREAVPTAQLRGAHADAALDVLISSGPAVARARVLLSANQPHLLVECGESTVRVGPLVVPGMTRCATCIGLSEADARADWPVLALQGDSRRPRVDPVTATVAGALIARAAISFLRGGAASAWRVGPHGVIPVAQAPPHPDCRCTDDHLAVHAARAMNDA
ncbi:hypothetical protein ACNI3K_04870 [Demequina sp. SO4-13]|uniref:hypothetical protein n=1 Tax=Demequina sp. SO4-13 TaxID=3401027 RepID=UPI003AF47A38